MWTFLKAHVDISAAHVDISAAQVDISAVHVDISPAHVDISGSCMLRLQPSFKRSGDAPDFEAELESEHSSTDAEPEPEIV